MREHIRQLIEEARLPQVATDGDGNRTTATAPLGSHAVRLARLAAAVHMHQATRQGGQFGTASSSELAEVRS